MFRPQIVSTWDILQRDIAKETSTKAWRPLPDYNGTSQKRYELPFHLRSWHGFSF